MPLATYLQLCLDVNDLPEATQFWAAALGLTPDDERPVLHGPTPQHDVWLNEVPEKHAVKNRVHLDLRSPDLARFGALTRLTEEGQFRWTTLAADEGDEFCVFVDQDVTTGRLKDIVVDARDPGRIAQWWADVLGAPITHVDGESYLSGVGGTAFEDVDFVPVPEPKTAKNRVHWDVRLLPGVTVDDLVAAGATVSRELPGWTVMADPEGNEFCAFPALG